MSLSEAGGGGWMGGDGAAAGERAGRDPRALAFVLSEWGAGRLQTGVTLLSCDRLVQRLHRSQGLGGLNLETADQTSAALGG